MWFDVEKKNYTTLAVDGVSAPELWFDVEKKNYTTTEDFKKLELGLWFDVEKKNYTTDNRKGGRRWSCGLM